MKTRSNFLGVAIRGFLLDYLPEQRGMSRNTITSYRESMKLLLSFISERKGSDVCDLVIEDIGTETTLAFLAYLEEERGNGARTRNVRLSAVHSFFRYLACISPEHLEHSQRVLSIPFKREPSLETEYLEFGEMTALLSAVDRGSADGKRDYALLALMFNTGARVSEIVDLKVRDLHLGKPSGVRIMGKGRKERVCPIWTETAQVLRDYLDCREGTLNGGQAVFVSHVGAPITRFGIGYIMKKYLKIASERCPSIAEKKLHPHSMRHSTAVHLLKSGVDLISIANWLGHSSVNTTNKYAVMDLEMKREALARAKPFDDGVADIGSWRRDPSILEWLNSL
ncbi:MAG: site-specific integrase [Candidatus Thermoplasmatota archaeon]|nr:site-specific integrase [Candidatus Thermoplasmatota archaeon]